MSEALLNSLPASPDVCVQKIDLAREAALLVQLDERGYRAASFLDDRILTPGLAGGWSALTSVVAAAGQVRAQRPLHFILHTGHVGSTLVSRLLGETGIVLPLREPLPLRTLADARDVLDKPESLLSPSQLDTLQAALMQLWGRGYDHTHSVLLKATSSACRVAGSLLEQQPAARAIYLNLGAEPYLATLLGGRNAALDLRGHGPVRVRFLHARMPTMQLALHALSPGELAGMSWLAETWNQCETIAAFGERVLAVDFDTFLADVPSGLQHIAAQFRLPLDAQQLAGLARSAVLTRYSKSPDFEYSPALRRQLLQDSRERNAVQIALGLRWLEQLARSQPRVADILNASTARVSR